MMGVLVWWLSEVWYQNKDKTHEFEAEPSSTAAATTAGSLVVTLVPLLASLAITLLVLFGVLGVRHSFSA